MYYYLDTSNNIQGPYSTHAYEKWLETEEIPAGTRLFDQNDCQYAIEEVVAKSLKSRTKVMFEEDLSLLENTNLDVTINMNHTYGGPNESTFIRSDFTQLGGECDDVDSGRTTGDTVLLHVSVEGMEMQKMVHVYVERRALFNRRRRFPDSYVPFEYSWPAWVPQPLDMSHALRGATNWRNWFREQDPVFFAQYLRFMNIENRPCHCCHVDFASAYDMLAHFLSVVHVFKTFGGDDDGTVRFSMIDVYCVEKMIKEVEAMTKSARPVHLKQLKAPPAEPSFFDDADVATAFESLHSTCVLSKRVPLMSPPKEWSDACEYIEALVLFRHLESEYAQTDPCFRRRRIGLMEPVRCNYCGGDDDVFDGSSLEEIACHLLSDRHIQHAARIGTSRTEIEYWISFFGALGYQKNRTERRCRKNDTVSLQENDFPLCYRLVDLAPGDFVYQGDDVDRVLRFVREHVRLHFPLLDDGHYRTSCRWCRVELSSRLGVLRHVLYDKKHTEKLRMVSNDDLRRLLKSLDVPITMPLFRQSQATQMNVVRAIDKKVQMQRLKNVAWRKYKQRAARSLAIQSFPMGLVNRCDLCQVDVEHVDAILTHFSSEKHGNSVLNSARIAESDIACWYEIFKQKTQQQAQTS